MTTNNILHVKAGKESSNPDEILDLRQRYGLECSEAATALGVPISVYECWESQGLSSRGLPSRVFTENCFIAYSRRFKPAYGKKNLIFGVYPLHVGRDLLCFDRNQMAEHYGGSGDTWKKYECNQRLLCSSVIRRIEADVRDRFALLCSAAEVE